MAFVYVVICCVIGIAVGGAVGNDATAGFGFFAGIAFGLVFARLRTLSRRIAAIEQKSAVAPAAAIARTAVSVEAAPTAAAPSEPATPPSPQPRPAAPAPSPIIDSAARRAAIAATATPPPSATPAAPPDAPRPGTSPPPGALDPAAAAIRRWFTEGNVPVKVGMLVLIAGVAALLKYASDQGWLHVPVELRLAGVAAAAIAALAFGWRQRERKRSFALSVEGGAIGVLLMTVFAAFRLYRLLPAGAAFGLMLVLVAGTGVLAVLQDALALAVLGLIAGFAAPILISTGEGNHVVLFSYYTLLNLAIFAIAWKKAWRTLNLLGFFFTYAIGTLWGVLRYEPALRGTTEPFLVIFFTIYLAIPILYAWRAGDAKRDLVDGTLVFGNPLVAFALQAALLDGERMPLAYSALALAAVYAVLAFALIRRERVRMLGESFAVLAVGFATLAVPLALSARSTACTFALEGAALVWLGMRQQRRLPRWTGIALQLIAAGAFAMSVTFGAGGADTTAIANGGFVSAILIAGAALASAWLLSREGAHTQPAALLYAWGLAWWIGAWLREIDRFVAPDRIPPALLGVLALTIALAGAAWHFVRRSAPAWTAAIALAFGIALALLFLEAGISPYTGWGLAAFAAYALAGFFGLAALRTASDRALGIAHSGWLWTWTVAIGVSLRQLAGQNALADGWRDALTLLPLLVAWMLVLRKPAVIAPPLGARIGAWRASLIASQALAAMVAFALLLIHDGATTPLAYVPILNPIELAQLAVLVCLARWLGDPETARDLAERRLTLIVAFGFAFVTAATLRAVHHLANVPWNGEIGSSMVAQTSLTVVWSVLGVVGWVMGSRRGSRPLWLAGAVLMGIVLAKLLLIDRTHLGSGFGIASFIAYGLLCTVIGYFAPAPPRATAAAARLGMRRALVLAISLCSASAASANTPADYAYLFPIEAHAANDASAWRVELTPDVYRYVQDANLRDVEIFNAEGKPVPMARIAIEPAATSREERTPLDVLVPELREGDSKPDDMRVHIDRDASGRVRAVAVGEGGASAAPMRVWLVDASKVDRAIDSITLTWREPASGLVARFAVDASDDLEHWRDVATGTVLALEQGGAKLERRDIALGSVKAKYLRLRRLDDGVAIAGLGVEARTIERGRAAPSRVWIDVAPAPSRIEANASQKGARYDYALVAPLPVEAARIELRNDNALAEIELLGRATDATTAPWQHVARLTAFRLRQGDEPLRNGDIELTATRRLRDFRIESTTTIAEAPKLSLAYRPDAFVFLAEGNGPFVLAAGSYGARRPDYPVEPALASLRASLGKDWQPPLASLGAAKASAGDAALRAPPPPLPWRRWLLWSVLVAGAALIAALSLSLLRAKRDE